MKKNLNKLLKNTHDQALKRRAILIVENLNLKGDEKVLDAGCGDGYYLKLLKQLYPNLELYGIDIDKKVLKVAYANLEKELNEKSITIYEKSITDSGFKDNFFDAVFSSEVLEHVPNDLEAVLEVKRILKKDGKFIFTVPNYNFPFLWDPLNWVLQNLFNTHIKSGFFAGLWNQHIRLYTIDSLIELVSKADMKTDLIKAVTYYSLPFNHYILNLGARLLHDTTIIKKDSSYNKFQMEEKVRENKFSLIGIYSFFVNLVDKKNDKIDASFPSVSLFFSIRK
jgi:2-polyprenyl-6-hydroxyphenyl methylase/3-demethylubiquinone-9 3-methyltransferase